ncbi:MAG: hypothetical protein JNK78_13770 [Planctomycetes bacterium]|nr:hypothetical protein [Planctomycetota bacterium]
MRAAAWLLLLCCTACANQRWFAPRENRNGVGPDGSPAAVYAFGTAPDAERDGGELRVWAAGTRFVPDRDDEVELVVGFELENHGAEPLALDTAALRCEAMTTDGQAATGLVPARWTGAAEAPAGGMARIGATFLLPECRHPRDLAQFTLQFRVVANGRPVLVQATPFLPWIPDNDWRDDGWWWGRYRYPYGYCGPGIGFGWHHAYWW